MLMLKFSFEAREIMICKTVLWRLLDGKTPRLKTVCLFTSKLTSPFFSLFVLSNTQSLIPEIINESSLCADTVACAEDKMM